MKIAMSGKGRKSTLGFKGDGKLSALARSMFADAVLLHADYIKARWNGSGAEPGDLPGDRDGEYTEKQGADGTWTWCYHPGPHDLAFMESEDRKYLKALSQANPLLFLEEMTPLKGHDKTQRGLDLTEPLHRSYQEDFMAEVARVCQERGIDAHPAWVQSHGGGGAAAPDLPSAEEGMLAKLRQQLVEAEAKIQTLQDQLTNKEARLAIATRAATPVLLRIWGGKHTPSDVRPAYHPVGKKTGGCAVGFIAEEEHPSKVKRYLAKSGMPKDERKVSETLSDGEELHYRSFLSVIQELIAAHCYTLLGAQAFYVPKHRLRMMDVFNEYTKENALAIAFMHEVNQGCAPADQITQGLHVLSRWITGYRDLTELPCYLDPDDQDPKSFQTWVEAGRVPEYASIEGHRVPILGLMEVLAASRLLADTDVLGGSSRCAGFVVESQEGSPVVVRVVKIDAGEAFNFSVDCNQFTQCFNPQHRGNKLQDLKDLQFGNNQPRVIQWAKLLDSQKQRFLHALRRGYEALRDERLLDFMIHRRGAFEEATPGITLFSPERAAEFKAAWRGYMDAQMSPAVYGAELAALPAAAMAASAAPFNPKAIGAASCTFAEALALSHAP
jgi:hypothetical protein